MMKFIFYCLVAYFVFRLVSFWRKIGQPKKPDQTPSPRTSGSGLMVKDDICQTYLPRESALREVIDGEERYFCSSECRRKCLEARKNNR
jgi:YHS domain-containing protein